MGALEAEAKQSREVQNHSMTAKTERFKTGGVTRPRGFAWNGSSFRTMSAEQADGIAVSRGLDGASAEVDLFRYGTRRWVMWWCNPEDSALGVTTRGMSRGCARSDLQPASADEARHAGSPALRVGNPN